MAYHCAFRKLAVCARWTMNMHWDKSEIGESSVWYWLEFIFTGMDLSIWSGNVDAFLLYGRYRMRTRWTCNGERSSSTIWIKPCAGSKSCCVETLLKNPHSSHFQLLSAIWLSTLLHSPHHWTDVSHSTSLDFIFILMCPSYHRPFAPCKSAIYQI